MSFVKNNRSLYQKIVIIITVITIVFWLFSYLIARQFLKNAIWGEFSESMHRTMTGIAKQSVNEIRYADYFEVRRTLQGFYDDKFMHYLAIYTGDKQLMAMYPRQLSGSDLQFLEEQVSTDMSVPYAQHFMKRDSAPFFHFSQQILDENNNVVGLIVVGGTTTHLIKVLNTQMILFAVLIFFILVVQIAAMGYASRVVTKPLNELTRMLQKNEEIEPEKFLPTFAYQTLPKGASSEVSLFHGVYQKLLQNIHAHIMHSQESAVQASIGKISSQVAHDLRSTISVLKGFIEYVKENGDADIAEFKASARRAVEKINRMADDLVDYTKARQIQPTSVNVCGLFDDVVHEFSETVRAKSIDLKTVCQKDLVAYLDSHKMNRILVNMLQNSIQAIPSKNGKIVLSASVSGSGWLLITIEDNGRGIDEKHLPRIFDSSFTFGKPSGTGLGLSYCRNVAEAHGGRISVESSFGNGSKFTIEIPLLVSRLTTQPDEQGFSSAKPVIAKSAKSVLVIDDDVDVLKQWELILKNLTPFEVVTVSDPDDLDQLDISPKIYRAVISDYRFDGKRVTGLDLIKLFKKKEIPCRYLCTGFYYDPTLRKDAIEAGAHAIIPKPIPEDLVKQLFA